MYKVSSGYESSSNTQSLNTDDYIFKTSVMLRLSRRLYWRHSFLEKDTVTVVGRHVEDTLRNF